MASGKCGRLTEFLWIFPFIGLAVLCLIAFYDQRSFDNPDGSCSRGPVLRMFDSEQEFTRRIGDQSRVAELHHIPTYENTGFCLDGSVPAFYYRAGKQSSKYQIYFEGPAGFCFDMDRCHARKQTRFGSSDKYKKYAWFDDEFLSTRKHVNSLSYDWNVIFVLYCDAMAYLADNANFHVWKKERIYFQGRQILDNLLRFLFVENNEFALDQATDIIVSASSTNGLALLLHANNIWNDYIKPIKNRNDNLRFMMLIESGYLRMVHDNTQKHLQWLYHLVYRSLNARCVEHFQHPKDKDNDVCIASESGASDCAQSSMDANAPLSVQTDLYRCLMLEHVMPFIDPEIRIFIMQSRFDFNYRHKDRQQVHEMMNKMGDEYLAFMLNEFLMVNDTMFNREYKTNRGAWITSCKHHCGEFNNIEIDGYTVTEAMYEFYHAQTNRNTWLQNEPFPCNDCCFIAPFSEHDAAPVHGCRLAD